MGSFDVIWGEVTMFISDKASTERLPLLRSSQDKTSTNPHNSAGNDSSSSLVGILKGMPLAGFFLVMLACILQTCASALVKSLPEADPFVVTVYRNCVIFLCSVPRLAWYKISPEPEGKHVNLLARALFTGFYTTSLFYCLGYLPLGDAIVITSCSPLFVTLLACVFLREPCGLFELFALVTTLSGILVMMHPPSLFGQEDGHIQVYTLEYFLAAGALAFGTFCQAAGYVVTRTVSEVDFAGKFQHFKLE